MLTPEHIRRAARLGHAYGEMRPGYLYNQSSNLTGPGESIGSGFTCSEREGSGSDYLVLSFDKETDEILISPEQH